MITIQRIGLEQAPLVQAIYERSPGYFRKVDASEVGSDFAEKDIQDCPPKEKQSTSYEKIFCLYRLGDKPIGIIDLHRNHPEKGVIYIGLLILDESFHQKGLGRQCFEVAEKFIKEELQCQLIKLGVAVDNNVEPFWSKMGFKRNGRTYTWKGNNRLNDVFEMEKPI